MENYLEPKFPGSLSGVSSFTRELENSKGVQEYLKGQDVYTLHKAVKKPSKYRKTVTSAPRDLWQMDLLDFQKYSVENDGYKYLCTIIITLGVLITLVRGNPSYQTGNPSYQTGNPSYQTG